MKDVGSINTTLRPNLERPTKMQNYFLMYRNETDSDHDNNTLVQSKFQELK